MSTSRRKKTIVKSTATIHQALQESKAPQSWNPFKVAMVGVGALTLGLTAYWWKYTSPEIAASLPMCSPAENPVALQFAEINNIDQMNYLAKLARFAGSSLAENLPQMVTRTVPCLFGPALYKWISSQMNKVTFVRAPEKVLIDADVQANGLYLPRLREGYIVLNTRLEKEPSTLVGTLRNEFFHRICDQANFHKTNDVMLRTLPFLNNDGVIDPALKHDYVIALNEFNRNIDSLAAITKKPLETLTSAQQTTLQNANDKLSNYHPIIMNLHASRAEYERDIKPFIKEIDGKLIIPKGKIKMNGQMVSNDLLVTSTQLNPNRVDLSVSNHGQTIAEIFVYDQLVQRAQLTANSPADVNMYKDKDKDALLAERGSDIGHLDPTARQHFAPSFCKYMGRYIGLEKDEFCDNSPHYSYPR